MPYFIDFSLFFSLVMFINGNSNGNFNAGRGRGGRLRQKASNHVNHLARRHRLLYYGFFVVFLIDFSGRGAGRGAKEGGR